MNKPVDEQRGKTYILEKNRARSRPGLTLPTL